MESAESTLKYLRNIEYFQNNRETSLLIQYVIRIENNTSLDSSFQALQIIGALLFQVKYLFLVLNLEIEGQKDPTFDNTFLELYE